jgi:hypothetical protein
VEVLRPFGIVEMVRTGQVVMTRGKQQREAEPVIPEAAQPRTAEMAAGAGAEEPKTLTHETETSHSV